ncbi:MAG: PIG-L family deacetylase [Armatimonadetes bacterium]|nr:PIG-L family deacetylase [Armatimonadota bacterium]
MPYPVKNPRFHLVFWTRLCRLPVWKRVLIAAFLLPFLLVGGTAGAFYLRLHQNARAASVSELPLFPSPQKNKHYLILAPHCDDETLAVGGFIADARAKGATVSVAFLTNGDGFRVAATRELKAVTVSPGDFVRFAVIRQAEAKRALQTLGVKPGDTYFLGYPDRGLRPMWEKNWTTPYRSYYTGHTRSPYLLTYTPHTPYTGQSLQNDLLKLMNAVRPTDVFVTHPGDDHPDHAASASFAQAALHAAKQTKAPWADTVRTHYYIVHRGDWPLPQGKYPGANLTPPAGLMTTDTAWRVYLLSPEAEAAKNAALSRYVSQLNICNRFLTSFVRTNELFGEMQTSVLPPETGSTTNDGWTTLGVGGSRDDVMRYVDPGADISKVCVQRRDGNKIAVRVTLRGAADTSRIRYSVQVGGGGAVQTVPLPEPDGKGSRILTVVVPVTPAPSGMIWVAAETRYRGTAKIPMRPVDRLGYNPLVWVLSKKSENYSIISDGFRERDGTGIMK